MPVKIENVTNFRIGKYGNSFLDLYRDNQKVLQSPNNLVTNAGGLFGTDDVLLCKPNSAKKDKRRKLFAIENATPIPTAVCRTPEGMKLLYDQYGRINDIRDPYLNKDPNKDFTDEEYDLLKSSFYGRGATANNQYDNVVVVSGISFRLREANVQWWQDPEESFILKDSFTSFGYDDSTPTSHYHNLCDPNKQIPKPIIVTDKRNIEQSSRSNPLGSFNVSYRYRYYLEIRHGLNTENYFFTLNTNPFIQNAMKVAKKRNSLILSWYVSATTNRNTESRWTSMGGNQSGQMFDLPDFIDVLFHADPCDLSPLSASQLGVT